MEKWEYENKFNPDEYNQIKLGIIQQRIEEDNEERNSSLLSDDNEDIKSLLNKLEKISNSKSQEDSYTDLFSLL